MQRPLERGRTATAQTHRFGWKRDPPDPRDYKYAPPNHLRPLPRHADLRESCPPVYNQKGLNSCSANSVAAAVEFDLIKQKKERVIFPSRLFIFYNARAMEGTTHSNEGVYIRDAVKSVARFGDCPESLWPYVEHMFARKPPRKCYEKALKYRAVEYRRITRNLDHLRGCLASGHPFIFGFSAHQKFHDVVKDTGVLNVPAPGEKVLGKHAVVAVGYDDSRSRLIVRNSWGRKFGLGGYFTMPYEYLLKKDLSADFWTIRVVGP